MLRMTGLLQGWLKGTVLAGACRRAWPRGARARCPPAAGKASVAWPAAAVAGAVRNCCFRITGPTLQRLGRLARSTSSAWMRPWGRLPAQTFPGATRAAWAELLGRVVGHQPAVGCSFFGSWRWTSPPPAPLPVGRRHWATRALRRWSWFDRPVFHRGRCRCKRPWRVPQTASGRRTRSAGLGGGESSAFRFDDQAIVSPTGADSPAGHQHSGKESLLGRPLHSHVCLVRFDTSTDSPRANWTRAGFFFQPTSTICPPSWVDAQGGHECRGSTKVLESQKLRRTHLLTGEGALGVEAAAPFGRSP